MARSVYVVPHTHWDREWYDPYPTFRLRLVDMLDELLPRLDADPGFAHFQLDGQMAVVDDYLEVRPEEAARLIRLSSQGRLSMGPWYVLPDEFLVSGETLVRDLQLGIATAERFGGAMDVGYLPDMFGHIASMPQLLGLFGLDHAVVWRGVPNAVDAPAFWWQSPDGTRVRAEYLSAGYGNGSNMPDNADELAERIALFVAFQGNLVGDVVLWMAGMDHEVPPAHLSRVVTELNARSSGSSDSAEAYSLTVGPLHDYLAGAPTDGLATHHGELRSGARANLLMGVASNRVDVKIAAAVAERSLERLAEPLISLWSADPRRSQSLLDLAWLEVIRNAAHDSICACSHDEVVDAVLHRYAEATRTATGLVDRATTEATSRLGTAGVSVLNPGSRDRNEVVEIEIPTVESGGPGTDGSLQVLQEFPAQEELHRTPAIDAPIIVAREMIYEHPSTTAVRLRSSVDDAGVALLEVHLLQPGEDLDAAMSTSEALGEIGQRCAADPTLVVATVLHRADPYLRTLAMSGSVDGYGWARWTLTAPDHPVQVLDDTATGGTVVDNGLVRVVVDPLDGTYSLNGTAGYGRLVDGGDAGDTYNWCPPDPDVLVDRPDSVTVSVIEHGPLRARVLIDARYRLPYEVQDREDGARRRIGESCVPIRTTLELRADEPLLRVETQLHNTVRDHRLRVHLPLPERAKRSVAECAFALVERPLFAEGGPNEWGVPTFPSRRFVQAGGLTVTHEGLCEYELVDLDGDTEDQGTTAGELALTLVRSTGWLSRGAMASRPLPAGPEDRLEGAQMQKQVTLRYAIALDPAADAGSDTGAVDPYSLAERVWVPLTAVAATGSGDLPSSGRHLRVRGAEVDAVLTDADGALVVRLHEPSGVAGAVEIRRGDAATTAWTGSVLDLRGRVLGLFDGHAELRPHQILTVRLDA